MELLADKELLEDVKKLVNNKENNTMSKTLLGVKLYEEGGEFINKCENLILEHGINEWRHHPYTDTMVLKEKTILFQPLIILRIFLK